LLPQEDRRNFRIRMKATIAWLGASNSQMSPGTRPPAFDDLIGPLIGRGYALAVTMLNDSTAAEDAVQEAAIKAWRKLPSLRNQSAIESWFLSIVANQCRSTLRGRWWSVLKFSELRENRSAEWNVESLDLDRAIDRLSAEMRVALLLHFYMDMTFEQVGSVLGISMTAARSRIYRALDRLRSDLQSQEALDHG
jgi:RNA polymerase sigma-70 factor (ECF subfamily)